MKTEISQHLREFKQLHEKAKIACKAGFALTCDAEEVARALEELAELRHEKSQGWALHAMLRLRAYAIQENQP